MQPTHPDDPLAFGDPFVLETLPLPRPADGYAVQYLGRDQLLDQVSGDFLPIRNPALKALHPSFDAARKAARNWLGNHGNSLEQHPLAIVPAAFDTVSERHILIYGVLQPQLEPLEEAAYVHPAPTPKPAP